MDNKTSELQKVKFKIHELIDQILIDKYALKKLGRVLDLEFIKLAKLKEYKDKLVEEYKDKLESELIGE